MIVKPRGTVTMPKMPKSLGSVIPWCRDVTLTLKQLRDRVIVVPNSKVSSTTEPDGPPCPFGEVYTYQVDDETKTGIRGGWIQAGDKTWFVEPYEIDPETDSDLLYWIEIGVTANTDDDGVAVLSGLETSTEPVWNSGPAGSGYPDTTIPVIFPAGVDPGEGEYIAPIGHLTITDGIISSLEGRACGNIIVEACPGVLSSRRYGIDP